MKRRILIIALILLLIVGLALFFFLNKEEEIIEPNYRYAEAGQLPQPIEVGACKSSS